MREYLPPPPFFGVSEIRLLWGFDVLDYFVGELEILDLDGASPGVGVDAEVVQVLEP